MRAKSGLGAAELAHSLVQIDAAARRCPRDATRRYLGGLGCEPPETLSAWGQGVESGLVALKLKTPRQATQRLALPNIRRQGLGVETSPAVQLICA
ncbi:MAG: hypothetical protein EBY28_02435 [Betaproteobacteria bacterium]|nr:hypothetical protein [Betaproteobacteria bacterium]